MEFNLFREVFEAKVIGIVLACLFITGLRLAIIKLVRADWQRQFWLLLSFKGIHLLMIAVFVWSVWYGPWADHPQPGLKARLTADLFDGGLLGWYMFYFMFQSYGIARELRNVRSTFRIYLAQYGFSWILLVDVLIVWRLDDVYLSLFLKMFPFVESWVFEALFIMIFVGIQFLALMLRRMGMIDAPSELRGLVNETARMFRIKIGSVKIWRLELVWNAFATGLIRRSIYITESLLGRAGREDLQMIIGHECAHFKLRHLEIRVLLIGGFIWLGSFLMEHFPGLHWRWFFLYAAAVWLTFTAIARNQELQADRLAARKLGGGAKMAEALIRVFGMNPLYSGFGRVFRWVVVHPEMEERIRRLKEV